MSKLFDRVKETCTVTGTGDITVTGAEDSSFFAYSDKYADGEIVPYTAVEDGAAFETGSGVYTLATGLIARTASRVTDSSNAGGLVVFGAGAKICGVTQSHDSIDEVNQSLTALNNNISLLHFYRATDHALTVQKMVDGFIDEFEDETGVDQGASTNNFHSKVNNSYSNTVDIEDITNNTKTVNGSFSVAANETAPTGVRLKKDGSKLYVSGTLADAIQQYSLTTIGDVTGTVTRDGQLSVAAQENIITGFCFNDDETVLLTIGTGSNAINQYSLLTAGDLLGTVTFEGSFSVADITSEAQGISLVNKGRTIVIVDNNGTLSNLHSYSLTSKDSILSGVQLQGSLALPTPLLAAVDIHFNPKESIAYISDDIQDKIYQLHLSVAADIFSRVTLEGEFDISAQGTNPRGVFFKEDGSRMYFVSSTNDSVHQTTFSIPAVTAMTLQSNPFAAIDQPDTANIVVYEEDIDAVAINTNLTAEITRDGATFGLVTLENVGVTTLGRNIYAGEVDLSSQPAGSSIKYKLVTTATAMKIHGVSVQCR